MLWIAGFLAMLLCVAVVAEIVWPYRFGPEVIAACAYSAWIVMLVFFPGRGQRGRNPFGVAARRVWSRLFLTHMVSLLVVFPAAVLVLYIRSRYAPRWLAAVCVVFAVIVSFTESLRMDMMLDESEAELQAGSSPEDAP